MMTDESLLRFDRARRTRMLGAMAVGILAGCGPDVETPIAAGAKAPVGAEAPAAAKKAVSIQAPKPPPEATVTPPNPSVCPGDTDRRFPEHDQRRLLRNVEKEVPQHVLDNTKATVIILGRDAISTCNTTHCWITPNSSYKKCAARESKCGKDLDVCDPHPFASEDILKEKETWPTHRCSGVFVLGNIVATASHCLNLTLGTSDASRASQEEVDGPISLIRKTKRSTQGLRTAKYGDVVVIAGLEDWSDAIPRAHIAQAAATLYLENWVVTDSAGNIKDIGDVALVQITPFEYKKKTDAIPLEVGVANVGSKPADKHGLYVVGHPAGLPQTISGCAEAKVDESRLAFQLTADVLSGSSGSPVFDAANGNLVGLIQDAGGPWREREGCCNHDGFEDNFARSVNLESAAKFLSRIREEQRSIHTKE